MGWFDDGMSDDDDDDDDARSTQKEEVGSSNYVDFNNDGGEDPLDAYMRTLEDQSRNTMVNDNICDNGRLDVECDDEATSHWMKNNNTAIGKNIGGTKNDDIESTNHSESQSSFHKASDQYFVSSATKDHREVNIQLQQVKHDDIKYLQFMKCILQINNRNSFEGLKWQKENQVTCKPPQGASSLDPIYDLAELRDILPDEVIGWNAIKNLTQPTLVQSQVLGVALCGKDAIITAPTGSGKTLSYLWPISSHLMTNYCNGGDNCSRALVLVPTRELALQVENIAKSMFAKLPLTALAITGGNMGRYQLSQKLQAKKPHCVIATPGRLLDVLNAQQKMKQEWLLRNITLLVLDEADKMIQLGFANQVTQILNNLRPDRQSLLVSATFNSRLQRRCQEWMDKPYRISIGKTGESSKHVIQHAICLKTAEAKVTFLKESITGFIGAGLTLVFCATRIGVEDVAKDLRTVLPVETLHGDRHLTDRKKALKSFAQGDVSVLVATDVAGRGLDIPQVSTIINFDPPKNWDTYVHRIGRAGRLSANDDQQEGSAYTLLLPTNIDFAKAMIQGYEKEKRQVPLDVLKLAKRDTGGSNRRFGHGSVQRVRSIDQLDIPMKKRRWSRPLS